MFGIGVLHAGSQGTGEPEVLQEAQWPVWGRGLGVGRLWSAMCDPVTNATQRVCAHKSAADFSVAVDGMLNGRPTD